MAFSLTPKPPIRSERSEHGSALLRMADSYLAEVDDALKIHPQFSLAENVAEIDRAVEEGVIPQEVGVEILNELYSTPSAAEAEDNMAKLVYEEHSDAA